MNTLTINVLGQPVIFLNQEVVSLPFSKMNGLIYYLVVEKKASRDDVASLLWPDKDLQVAKKNLRNTIYQLHKTLGFPVINSKNRKELAFDDNHQVKLHSDFWKFIENPKENLELYKGELLEHFYMKDAEEFDFWISNQRRQVNQLYLHHAYQKLDQKKSLRSFEEQERILLKLIELDEFEEESYYLLMELYAKQNRLSKVIEVYYRLVNLLDKELDISPKSKIQTLYQEVIDGQKDKGQTDYFLRNSSYFLGRESEIQELESLLSQVVSKQSLEAMMIVGGTGLGKRTVTRQVLANQRDSFEIMVVECEPEEVSWPFQAWIQLLDDLEERLLDAGKPADQGQIQKLDRVRQAMKTHASLQDMSRMLVHLFRRLCKEKNQLILFEDIHWMDANSAELLEILVKRLKQEPIAFLFTKHVSTPAYLKKTFRSLRAEGILKVLKLEGLNEQLSQEFLERELGDQTVNPDLWKKIYRYSQGSPFLLEEYAQHIRRGKEFHPITERIQSKLALRFSTLTEEEAACLQCLSCFQDAAFLEDIRSLTQETEENFLNLLDSLIHKQILVEHPDQHLRYSFREEIVKAYWYETLTHGRKRSLHIQLAKELESRLRRNHEDLELFSEIAFHYREGHDFLQALSYRARYLEANLKMDHELFPLHLVPNHSSWNETVIKTELAQMERELDELSLSDKGKEVYRLLQLQFDYICGRFYIYQGDYQEGLPLIHKVVKLAAELNQLSYLMKGYRQLIYFCIQTEELEDMNRYTEKALGLAIQMNNHEAIAVNLRLRGLYYLMVGQLDQALHCLQESVSSFSLTTDLEQVYQLQIAAAMDYIAEIYKIKGEVDHAISLEERALEQGEDASHLAATIIFEIGLGITSYWKGAPRESIKALTDAKEKMKRSHFTWRKVEVEFYLSLLHLEEKGSGKEAKKFLSQEKQALSHYSNPREKGFYAALKAFLVDKGLVEGKKEAYVQTACQLLNPYRDTHLLAKLREL